MVDDTAPTLSNGLRRDCAQLSGVQLPSGLRQAAPRAVFASVLIVTVWLYWRQFCDPT